MPVEKEEVSVDVSSYGHKTKTFAVARWYKIEGTCTDARVAI